MNNLNKQNLSDREKRVAPRFQVDLKAPVIITVVSFDDEGTESYFVMRGRLLNVSRTGLALIISNKDIQEFYKLKGNLVFRLLLPLPVEAIELEVIPVRHQQQLNSAGIEEKLIGAHITNMNGRHRVIFMEFINQFEFTESAAPQIIEIAKQNDFNQNEIVGMNFIQRLFEQNSTAAYFESSAKTGMIALWREIITLIE